MQPNADRVPPRARRCPAGFSWINSGFDSLRPASSNCCVR